MSQDQVAGSSKVQSKHIIEINGRRYDATSGAPLDAPTPAKPAVAQSVTVAPKPVAKKPQRPTTAQVNHVQHHQAETAHTLMRHAVKKPASGLKRQLKVTSALSNGEATVTVAVKHSVSNVSEHRAKRASLIEKNTHVRRFAAVVPGQVVVPTVLADTPLRAAVTDKQAEPDMFARALERATGHQQPAHKLAKRQRKGRRALVLGGSLVTILALVGLVIQQNSANLGLLKATNTAGFTASLPDYRPADFSLKGYQSKPGTVVIAYHSNSDERKYSISESPSSIDNGALVDSLDQAGEIASLQTLTVGNETVYMYGDQNATWVDHGMLYQVTSNGSLSSRAIEDIVAGF